MSESSGGPTVVVLLVGLAFLVLGVLMSVSPRVAEWGLTHGRGRIWARVLGMERAMKVTRFFFGPVVALLGLVALVAAIIR